MIRISKLLLLATIISLSAAYASSQPILTIAGLQPEAAGFQGYGQGQVITCSSDDGRRNYCNVDTRRGVRLNRQISGSPCVENQTWGVDNRGLWVDRGCRAEFVVNGGGNWNGGGQGQVITCSSDDGGRHYCDADTRRGVRLSRQISGSACVETQTWGYDNRGVWVDRGCRAEFSIGGGGNWGPGQGNWPGQGQTITCSSDDGRRNYCQTNGDLRRIVLTRQISGSPCVQNQTWGVDNRGLWVDRGCRAEFSFGGGGWRPGQGQGPGQSQIITCSSDDGRRNFCSINGYNSNSVVLTRQISGSPCVQNQTWGVDRRRGLWVDRGCRAEFQVSR